MMKSYDTLSEALQDLKKRGYTTDFNVDSNSLKSNDQQMNPEDFEVKEVYRFEGFSNPDDSSVVYAIESKNGIKGVLVDAYGTYADVLTLEVARKLKENLKL